MLQAPRLMQRPRSFESLCGLNLSEFTLLVEQLEPLWTRAHRTSLLREGRQRRIGAGRQFKLDVPHRLLLTLMYLRHYLPMHLLGVLFEMDAANVCRNVHALLPLLEQAAAEIQPVIFHLILPSEALLRLVILVANCAAINADTPADFALFKLLRRAPVGEDYARRRQ